MNPQAKSPVLIAKALLARARLNAPGGPRFAGVYADRAAALAATPEDQQNGYDDARLADVSFEWMSTRHASDYPLVFWLNHLLPKGGRVIDFGGNLGTKYIAFQDVLDMIKIDWAVCDLPGIIATAKERQAAGQLPPRVSFSDTPEEMRVGDVLLASGVLQYLDTDLSRLLGRLTGRPRAILVHKLPLHQRAFVTLERIGPARVPYRVRTSLAWDKEVAAAGYIIADRWPIEALNHKIPTHPWLGETTSHGYLLTRAN